VIRQSVYVNYNEVTINYVKDKDHFERERKKIKITNVANKL